MERTSRRKLLMGGAAAVAAVAAEAGIAQPTQAATGDPVILGKDNRARTTTSITNRSNDPSSGGLSVAAVAEASHTAISAFGGNRGIYATGRVGVEGETFDAEGFGVLGENSSGDAIRGEGRIGVRGRGMIGIIGTGTNIGVSAEATTTGTAITGVADEGIAIEVQTNNGMGVRGFAKTADGIGISAENHAGGVALHVEGPAEFSRSGLVTVPAGLSSATVNGVTLTASSFVLATVQQIGSVQVQSAVPDSASNLIAINLNRVAPVDTRVAWFVVG